MESKQIVVHADRDPMKDVPDPGPHQIYKNPSVCMESRKLGELHPDAVRVQMIYGGICGTDVHLVERNPDTHYIRSSAPVDIPTDGRVIGHEGVGKILASGSNVRHLKPGAHVTFESIIVCHYCDVCRKGFFNQCRHAKLLGLEKDGLFGTIVDVPAMLAHDVSDWVASERDLQAAACVEPAGVAYVACQNAQIAGGDSVVVFGGGPIGIFTSILAKQVFGASEVHLVEPVDFRREFAGKWNDNVYDVDEFFSNSSRRYDVVVEASGYIKNVNRIFRQVNANGRIVMLARSGFPLTLDALDHMITNAISITGSRGHLCGAFSAIFNLYQRGRIPLPEIITEIVDGPEALCEFLQTPDTILNDNCKVLIRFNGAHSD